MAVLSRYANQSTFENRQGNTYSRQYKRLSKDRDYYTITLTRPSTFDLLAAQQYGSPLLYWMIADFNDYLDPTVTLPAGTVVKIPRQA